MQVALYARVSTQRQAQAQTIEEQLARLQAQARQQGWAVTPERIFRDDGYRGTTLARPGLDALRDRAAAAVLDVVLVAAPDRLARKYVHQVLLVYELDAALRPIKSAYLGDPAEIRRAQAAVAQQGRAQA